MSNDRNEANVYFDETSFLYGGNADYIEAMHARWQDNPSAVAPEWQAFFAGVGDDPITVKKNAEGA